MSNTKRRPKQEHEGVQAQRPKPGIMALVNAVNLAEGYAYSGLTELATPRVYCERAGGWRDLTRHELAEVKRYHQREAQRLLFRERQFEAEEREYLANERAAADRAREERQFVAREQERQRQSTKPWLAIVRASS